MRWLKTATPPASLVFLATSLSALDLSGCRPEADVSNRGAEEVEGGEVRSGLQVATYDFLTNAPGAFWHNNDGGLVWGTNNSTGACMMTSGVIGDVPVSVEI